MARESPPFRGVAVEVRFNEEEVGDEEDAGFGGPCVAALSDYLSVFLEEGSLGGSTHRPTLALPFCSRSSVGRGCGGARQEASAAAYRRWCQKSPFFGLLHV